MNLDKLFHLKENHTDVKTEIMAGITTFMTMAYILAVNPNILSASGMDRGSIFTATALSAFIATCLMALLSPTTRASHCRRIESFPLRTGKSPETR